MVWHVMFPSVLVSIGQQFLLRRVHVPRQEKTRKNKPSFHVRACLSFFSLSHHTRQNSVLDH